MKTRIYVDRHVVARNRQGGRAAPPLVIRTHRGTRRAKTIKIKGPSQLIYSPDKPLSGGATIWIETEGEVV